MNAADRFTDHHVRMNPDLRDMAIEYAIGYEGDFEFLLKVRHRLMDDPDAELSTATIRGILNCMRYDPLVSASMPTPGMSQVQRTPKPVRPPYLKVVPDRRPAVRLDAKFKKPYLLNTTPKMPSNNPRAHILNHARSGITVDNGEFIYLLVAWCGWNVSNRQYSHQVHYRLADEPDGLPVCKGCAKLIQKVGRAL